MTLDRVYGGTRVHFVSVVTNSQGQTHSRFIQCSSCQDVNSFLWCTISSACVTIKASM